jgi:RHS repeat-associated protein
VPDTLSETLSISHQDVAITVENLYGTQTDPVPNIPVYLFKPPSSYLGKSATTDSNGQVGFSLPERSYKVRADYLGYQFWSGEFVWADTSVTIENGIAQIHVHRSGSPVVGARVYLFKGSGGYLGRYAHTDGEGIAEFQLPDRQYKFRVDWEGAQYWSDPVTIIPHEVNEIDMDLDLLGLNLTGSRLYAHNTTKGIQLAMVGLPYGLLVSSVIAAPGISEKIYYYHNDHLGTAQVLTDDQGQVVWKGDYKPFGAVDIVVETVGNDLRFPGQYYDGETGLHYNYYRYYHPVIGRLLTFDPSLQLSFKDFPFYLYLFLSTPELLNPYSFVTNNPINFSDRFGLSLDFDCEKMRMQEWLSKQPPARIIKDRVCTAAYNNCRGSIETIVSPDDPFCKEKKDELLVECAKSYTKCLACKGFTFPEMFHKYCEELDKKRKITPLAGFLQYGPGPI